MGKSSSQKQAEAQDLAIQQQQLELQRQQAAYAQQAMQLQQQAYQQISPFAQSAMNLGQQAMQGQVPSQFLAPAYTQIAQNTQQNQQNLLDFFGSSGQAAGGLNSGVLAGPLANTMATQSQQQAGALQNAQMNLLGLGFQGAGLLAGQQNIFNPSLIANSASYGAQAGNMNPQQFANPWVGALGGALGGLGSAVGGGLARYCWVAASFYGWDDVRTSTIRSWILTKAPSWLRKFYGKHGPWIAKTPLRWLFLPLFKHILAR